ncbi:MAG: hypothetical protein CEE38_09210 [Planctomycetes bacterium B3_Pla]|nr:MAG: hypothetical protein CEE38_09210 [Planctomycetes bacterium B3_Pla]
MNELMNSCLAGLNDVGRWFCSFSANMLVQSGILIILLLVIDLLMRKRMRATFRYWIWMLVFVKLVLPPSLSMPTGIGYWVGDRLSAAPVSERLPSAEQHESATIAASEHPGPSADIPPAQPSRTVPEPAAQVASAASTVAARPTWQAVAFLIWLAGVSVISIFLIRRIKFVRRLIAQSTSAETQSVDMLNQCRQEIGVRRNIQLKLSTGTPSPAVCGLFKPTILIPAALPQKLSPDKLRAVLIHELVHIKRCDLWFNSAQTLLQIAYFYNPLVWLVNAVVRRIREQAVDEMVLVTLGTEAKSYGNTLIDIAEMAFFKTSLSLHLIGVVESKKALHGRIRHMLNRPIPKSAKVGALGTLLIMVLAVVFLPMAKAQKKNLPKQEKIQVNAQKSNRFEATLSNGVTVELAGVCEHPSAGKQWWRPDGTPMDTHQFRDYDYDDAVTVEEDEYVRLLALKFDDDAVQDIQISSSLEDSRGRRFAPDYSDRKRRIRRPIQVILAAFRETTESTNLRLGIAAEPWKTVSVGTHGRSVAYARDSIAQRAIIYSEAIEKNGRICITATHLVDAGYDCRIYARGKDGEVYEPVKHSNSNAGSEMGLCKSEFGIPLEKVKMFHLQARPFRWVTFENISLQRGLKTTPLILLTPEVKEQQTVADAPKTAPDVKSSGENLQITASPLTAFERKLIERVLEQVKEVDRKTIGKAMHSPEGPKLYHVDSQGKVTVWVYQRLPRGRKDCAEDEVGWGSSQLVDAKGMYYLPDGTPLQSRWRWRERPGGMTNIRVKIGRPVADNEHVGLIHRHELPSYFDLYSRDGRERRILFYTFKDEPLSIIVRVDRPMRLGGWSLGNAKRNDVKRLERYDHDLLLATGPAGDGNMPMLVTVQLPKGATTGQKAGVQVESEKP